MISHAFAKGPAFVAYITGGHGGLNYSLECASALVEGGADLIELGIPFSDPIADGPVIQSAMMSALSLKITPENVLEIAGKLKKRTQIPLILFSYYNPLLKLGPGFLDEAVKQGIDGILIIDLPAEENIPLPSTMQRILVASPSSSDQRLESIARIGQGFIYYVCQKGTTGIRKQLPEGFVENVERIKAKTSLPVAAGFGISNRATAKDAIAHADGFVVGSYFVDAMEKNISPEKLKLMAQEIDPRRIV